MVHIERMKQFDVKKILVIGCPGSGKSTFARKLRDATGLPLYYLDMLYHRPDRSTAPREEFDAVLAEILAEDEWIIDGNYLRTLPLRLAACDTVFFFDLPVEQCLEGAASRVGTVREDLPWVESELDPDFRQYIIDFPNDQLPAIRVRLQDLSAPAAAGSSSGSKSSPRLVTFTGRHQADEFISALRSGHAMPEIRPVQD